MTSSTIKGAAVILLAAIVVFIVYWWGSSPVRINGTQTESKEKLSPNKRPKIFPAAKKQKTTVAPQSTSACGSSCRGACLKTRNYTVVTAFFSIGPVRKGKDPVLRNASTYIEWMWPYGYMLNGVVAYFDDAVIASAFAEVRRDLPTKVVLVDRSELWAFSLLNRTREIFSQPDYPKNPPKSTSAEYVSTMHSKFELVARAAQGDDPFLSSHISWMDIGLYRELPKSYNETFMLRVHPCLLDDAILFTRIYSMPTSNTVESVMRNGIDWVGGGFFTARREVAIRFFEDFVRHVELFLDSNLANHEQSVLLAMYLPTTAPRPAVPLQAMMPGRGNKWFYMAYQARSDGLSVSRADNASSYNAVSCSYEIYS